MKIKMCLSIFRHMQYKEPVPSILENIFLTLKKMNQTFFWYLYNKKKCLYNHNKNHQRCVQISFYQIMMTRVTEQN